MVDFTLNKFGVPLEGGRQGPMLMPKLKYRFRVRFLNFGTIGNPAQAITLNTDSMTFPSLSHDVQEVHAYNSRAYYAGKHSWGTVEVVVRDDVTNSVSRVVASQEQRQLDHYNQTGYRSATDYKFTAMLEAMDGGNDAVLESWTLEGCFLSEVNYGDANYSDSGYRTISLTIRPDNCTYVDEAGNRLMASPSSDPQGRNL